MKYSLIKDITLPLLLLTVVACQTEILSDIEKNAIKESIFSIKTCFHSKCEIISIDLGNNPTLPEKHIYGTSINYSKNNTFKIVGVQKDLPEFNEVFCIVLKHDKDIVPVIYYRSKKKFFKMEGFLPMDKTLLQLNKSNCPNYGTVKWYQNVAQQGFIFAQNNLGNIYDKGKGIKPDKILAVKWYRKAAEQGDAIAQNNLGGMYNKGEGVKQDKTEAVKWYRKAAEQGDAVGQYNLGVMYDKGQGVKPNQTEAAKWYHNAAEQGLATAQYRLGLMYFDGEGVERDTEKAIEWYKKSAKQNNENAIQALKGIDILDISDMLR